MPRPACRPGTEGSATGRRNQAGRPPKPHEAKPGAGPPRRKGGQAGERLLCSRTTWRFRGLGISSGRPYGVDLRLARPELADRPPAGSPAAPSATTPRATAPTATAPRRQEGGEPRTLVASRRRSPPVGRLRGGPSPGTALGSWSSVRSAAAWANSRSLRRLPARAVYRLAVGRPVARRRPREWSSRRSSRRSRSRSRGAGSRGPGPSRRGSRRRRGGGGSRRGRGSRGATGRRRRASRRGRRGRRRRGTGTRWGWLLIGAAVVIVLALIVPAFFGGGTEPGADRHHRGVRGARDDRAPSRHHRGPAPDGRRAAPPGRPGRAGRGRRGRLGDRPARRPGHRDLGDQAGREPGPDREQRPLRGHAHHAGHPAEPAHGGRRRPRVRLVGRYQLPGAAAPVTVVRLRFDPRPSSGATSRTADYLEAFELADAAVIHPSFRG